jgi:capsular exopolysaccharide synthesis family protein
VASPLSVEQAETEQLLPEAAPVDVSPSDVAQPFSAQEAAVATYSRAKSVESVPARPVAVRVPPESRLVALTDPNSLGAEKFRALVTRLEHLRKERELKCFQVTSSVIHEGKTVVSGNVAVTLAKYSGSKTLLIEGDLHRPTLATMFGLNNIRGLSHWWYRQGQDLAQFAYRLGDLPLWFLPAGHPYDRPSDILRSARFVNAFAQLASRFEWIVVDSTPMLPIVDVNLWSRLVDGTLLVVREGVTPVKALKQGLLALDHPKLIGVVLNDASATTEAKYDGQYYGSTKR